MRHYHRYLYQRQVAFAVSERLSYEAQPHRESTTEPSITMIKPKALYISFLASIFISTSFGASFIKFDGVDGEAKDSNHRGWIDVFSISGIVLNGEKSSGLPTGKRQHKPITITKRIDKATPMLAQATWTSGNPTFPNRITVKQGGVSYDLSGVKVTSSKKVGDKEVLTLSYRSISKSIGSTRATDYNSSRSNKADSARRASPKPPANHNTTRSK